MRWIKIPLSIFLALCFSFNNAPLAIPAADAREMSKAGEVFQKVQAGVVTVFTGAGHGSGFLADDSGLVVTNSHVVNEKAGHLRVKFGRDQIVEAIVVENDREHDVAILQVNLKNILTPYVIPLFSSKTETPVLVGEQVLAIGSPLQREVLEKLMTVGVVGKYDGSVIFHDANINGGNSGGPLLNFDGEVVGINTFSVAEKTLEELQDLAVLHKTRGPSGAVPVKFISHALERAKAKQLVSQTDETLLPDVPETPYPISEFQKTRPEFFIAKRASETRLHSGSFSLAFQTPPQRYSQSLLDDASYLQLRNQRSKRKKFTLSADEFSHLNQKYYEYCKPVVTLDVYPKTKLTEGTKARNATLFLGAATLTALSAGALAPLMVVPFALPQHQEFKKDFLRLALVGEDGKATATPIETGRSNLKAQLDEALGRGKTTRDKTYIGHYSFDATAFDTEKKLSIVIAAEGNGKIEVIKIPDKVKKQIVADFQPYWASVRQNQEDAPVRAALKTSVEVAK